MHLWYCLYQVQLGRCGNNVVLLLSRYDCLPALSCNNGADVPQLNKTTTAWKGLGEKEISTIFLKWSKNQHCATGTQADPNHELEIGANTSKIDIEAPTPHITYSNSFHACLSYPFSVGELLNGNKDTVYRVRLLQVRRDWIVPPYYTSELSIVFLSHREESVCYKPKRKCQTIQFPLKTDNIPSDAVV